jgi:hypothetical protein
LFYDQFYKHRKNKWYVMDILDLSKSKFYRVRQGMVESLAIEMGLLDLT